MQCFSPITAFKLRDGGLSFSEIKDSREIAIRCGQCIGCRVYRAESWTTRILHESKMHSVSTFVTLTYDDEHLPTHGTLHYPHVQKFIRAQRQKLGKFRFFVCGEYGDQTARPHYHAIFFGLDYPDRVRANPLAAKHAVYRSPCLAKLWPHGAHQIGFISPESARYVAQYSVKKVTGKRAASHYEKMDPVTGELVSVVPEFARMSLRPALGKTWLEKYGQEILTHDNIVLNGSFHGIPRYYNELLSQMFPIEMEALQAKRALNALDKSDDNSRVRLETKAIVANAKHDFYRKRNL